MFFYLSRIGTSVCQQINLVALFFFLEWLKLNIVEDLGFLFLNKPYNRFFVLLWNFVPMS